MMMKIVISDDRFGWNDEEEQAFSGFSAELVVADCHTEPDVIAACADADAILLNQAPVTAAVVEKLRRCRVISRYGIGYDNVDIRAAEKKGIWVTNVPGYCTEEVAEHALGMLLCCVRRIPFKDRGVRRGGWNLNQPIRRMSGRTLGILGFGATGRAFWEKVQGFGFSRILVCDPSIERKLLPGMFGEAASFDDVIGCSDFISLHLPLREDTRHIINRRTIANMKDGAIIINTSRGPVINEDDLIEALNTGKLGAAGLDVFEREPLPPSSPLIGMDNVILTDHSAYYSQEAVSILKTRTAMNARDVLEGRVPKTAVNRPRV
ncbi:C-terminal binding protein [Breznakiella homolactica]|uniref:C-terminal binding protein n=1 Tax=Breznakiella homolactica TaxID=2798577 RepID=A0A7T7XMJ6_9SPIR|nr:C-terminal binding protein [Breznakiella homolactica]QQO09114.1 C-terminal binding protein [Breznakiella homolactica]